MSLMNKKYDEESDMRKNANFHEFKKRKTSESILLKIERILLLCDKIPWNDSLLNTLYALPVEMKRFQKATGFALLIWKPCMSDL